MRHAENSFWNDSQQTSSVLSISDEALQYTAHLKLHETKINVALARLDFS
jgi:hypothetical protein